MIADKHKKILNTIKNLLIDNNVVMYGSYDGRICFEDAPSDNSDQQTREAIDFNLKESYTEDHSLGIDCPTCEAPLTIFNVGGYRNLCKKCVNKLPEFPKDGGGYVIDGKYPNLKWVRSE